MADSEQLSTLTAALTQQNKSRKLTKLQLAKEQIENMDENCAVRTRRQFNVSYLEHDNDNEFTIQLGRITSRADIHESIFTAGKTQCSE